MNWSSNISTVLTGMKSKLTAAGFTVVSNKQLVDGGDENVVAVTVTNISFGDVPEQTTGSVNVQVIYRHNNDTDEETFVAIGEIEDVFSDYQAAGAIGLKEISVDNFYRVRSGEKSIAVITYNVII